MGFTGGEDEVSTDENRVEVMDLDLDEEGEVGLQLQKALLQRGRVAERKNAGGLADASTITKGLVAVVLSNKPTITAAPSSNPPMQLNLAPSSSSGLSATGLNTTSNSGQSTRATANAWVQVLTRKTREHHPARFPRTSREARRVLG